MIIRTLVHYYFNNVSDAAGNAATEVTRTVNVNDQNFETSDID